MEPVKKILCAVDFEEHSTLVAEYAKAMAKAFGAQLVVTHVVKLNTGAGLAAGAEHELDSAPAPHMEVELRAAGEKNMGEFMRQRFQDGHTAGRVVLGDPAEQILAQARTHEADLIVMGTVGRKGLTGLLFGSVAQEVVRSAPVPVLTVRPETAAEGQAPG